MDRTFLPGRRSTLTAALAGATMGALLLASVATTFAAKGSGGSTAPTSWIALASVQGAAAATSQPALGSTVGFNTAYPKTVKNPRIEVLCYQGGELVYGEAGGVTDTFLLGGGWSLWKDRGGAADCTANLYYFGFRAGVQTYNWLASTYFSAAAPA